MNNTCSNLLHPRKKKSQESVYILFFFHMNKDRKRTERDFRRPHGPYIYKIQWARYMTPRFIKLNSFAAIFRYILYV